MASFNDLNDFGSESEGEDFNPAPEVGSEDEAASDAEESAPRKVASKQDSPVRALDYDELENPDDDNPE